MISANGGLPAHRYTPQVTQRWPRGSKPASAASHHSWLGSAGRGGGCLRGWGFPVLCVLVARRVRVVPVLVCVVWCAFVVSVLVVVWAWAGPPRVFVCVCVCVRVWCVGGVRCGAVWRVDGAVAGVWCGWSLATPGGGSCVLLPATPGWVSLPVVVGVPRHSWLRVSGAAPLHSWLGSAGRGGGCFRGWGFPVLCVLVARRVRVVPVLVSVVCVRGVCVGGGVGVGAPSVCVCVCACVCVCGVLVACGLVRCGVFVGLWLVCGVVGRSPLLAEVPVCYSPPPSGWVSLPVVVGVPRHSWLRVPGAVPRHSWLGSAGGGGVRLPATPGSGLPVVVVCFAGGGVPCCVCLWRVWLCAVAVLCCVLSVCGSPHCWWCGVVRCGVLVGLLLVCGVVGLSPLLAEVPVCHSPRLLAAFRCRCWWAFLATPG